MLRRSAITSSGLSGPASSSSAAAAAVGSPAGSAGLRRRRPLRPRRARPTAASRRAGATSSPASSIARDRDDDLVDRRADGLEARGRQMREVGGRRRARDLGLHHVAARTPSSAWRAPRMSCSRVAEVARAARSRARRARALRCLQRLERAHVLVEQRLGLLESTRAAPRAAPRCARCRPARAGDARVELARGLFEPRRPRCRAPTRARSSVACSVRALGDEPHAAFGRLARRLQPRQDVAQPALGAALLRSRAVAIAATASSRRRSAACSSSSARRRSVRDDVEPARRRARVLRPRARPARRAPTIAFSCSCCAVDAPPRAPSRRRRSAASSAAASSVMRVRARRPRPRPASRSVAHLGARLENAARVLPRAAFDEPARRETLRPPSSRRAPTRCAPARAPRRTTRRSARRPSSRRQRGRVRAGRAHDARRARARPPARRPATSAPAALAASSSTTNPQRPALALGQRAPARSCDVARAIDEHVLEQIAEQRVDRALERALDVEVIGDGAVLTQRRAGLGEQEARRVAERRAAGFEFFERPQPRFVAGEIALARRERAAEQRSRSARGATRAPLRPRRARRRRRRRAARAAAERLRPPASRSRRRRVGFGCEIARFDVEPLALGGDAVAHGGRIVARLPQRRQRRRRRQHGRARLVGFAARPPARRPARGGSRASRASTSRPASSSAWRAPRRGLALRLDRQPRRVAPLLEIARPRRASASACARQVVDLLLVELNLLLAAADLELARVRLARASPSRPTRPRSARGAASRARSRARRRARRPPASRARASVEPRLGRLDLARQRLVPARELHLLPAAQFLAQPLVAPRARRLALAARRAASRLRR